MSEELDSICSNSLVTSFLMQTDKQLDKHSPFDRKGHVRWLLGNKNDTIGEFSWALVRK